MARRIIAVVSQSPDGSPHRRHFEEQLVAALMMQEGVDLNVIPHLEHLAPESTGLLCLEGIKGEMLLLSWLEPSAALAALQSKGIDGRLAGSRGGPQPASMRPGDANRAIYCLDLRGRESVEELLAEVLRIRDDARVQIVPILGMVSAPRVPAVAGSPAVVLPRNIAASDGNDGKYENHDDREEKLLEQLVDELDTMNL